MSRRILLILSSILFSITFSSQPMAMAMAPKQMAMAYSIPKTVSFDFWHITISSGHVYTFTDQQISQIVSTMPSDYRARFFNDPGVLCSYIEKQNITPECLKPTSSQSFSSYESNHSRYERDNAVFARMYEIKQQLHQNRPVANLRVEVNKAFASYNELRIKGEQKKLNEELKKLKEEFASKWFFGKDKLRQKIQYLEAILSQSITSKLAIVKNGPLERAEKIVSELKNSWPYSSHIITSITEQAHIDHYKAAVGFNELEAAQALLDKRPDYQQKLIERKQQFEAKRIAREQEIQSRCVVSESLKPILSTIEQQTQDLDLLPLSLAQEQEKAALLEMLKEHRFDWSTTTPSQKQMDIDCEINSLITYYSEHCVRANKPESKMLILNILSGLQHLKKNNRTDYLQYKTVQSQLPFAAKEVSQFVQELAEKTGHRVLYNVTHPVEFAANFAKANIEIAKFVTEFTFGQYYLTEQQQWERFENMIRTYEQLREMIPQMSRGEVTDFLSQFIGDGLVLRYGFKGISKLNNLRVSNKDYVSRFIERIKFKIDTYAQRHPEIVTTEGLILSAAQQQSQGWFQWMKEKVWGGKSPLSLVIKDFAKLHPSLEKNIASLEYLERKVAELGTIVSKEKIAEILPQTHTSRIHNIEKEAFEFYEKIKQTSEDIIVISKNTGIDTQVLKQIKNHVFIDKHLIYGKIQHFSPDIDMACAWKRLMNNNYVYSDLVLLQHEFAESFIMNGIDISWEIAHQIVNNKYNWLSHLKG